MAVRAMYDYEAEPKDILVNFHGNQLVYIGWDKHLMFCAPVCLPLPPDMPFSALISDVLPGVYSSHPDWERIDWDQVRWTLNQQSFEAVMDKGLKDQGIGHKSLLRFYVPGLDGIQGVAS